MPPGRELRAYLNEVAPVGGTTLKGWLVWYGITSEGPCITIAFVPRSRRVGKESAVFKASGLEPTRSQDLVISLMGTYVHGRDALVWSGGLVALLAEFGFSMGASRAALSRLVRRQLLRPVKRGRTVHYEITGRLAQALDEGQDRIFTFARGELAAESWTFVWHTMPEAMRVERGLLASRLRFFGFGPIQPGTWIAPHHREVEVLRLIRELDVGAHTVVFAARPSADADISRLIERVWDLSLVARRYARFVQEFEPYASGGVRAKLSDRDSCLIRTRVAHAFRGFVTMDPELPDGLMPGAEWRRRAVAIFDGLYTELEPAGRRYFEARTEQLTAQSTEA